jgi:hypothetical protein
MIPEMVDAAEFVIVIPVSALIAAAVNAAVVTVMFLSDVVPPTAPVNVALPLPAATVIDSVLAVVPLTVKLNVTAASVVVNVVSPINSTAPLYVWVVVVVTPPLNLAVPVAFVVNDPVTDKL